MISIVGDFDAQALSWLENQLTDRRIQHTDQLKAQADCEILVIRSATKIGESQLKALPRLKLLITSTSGYNHIDLDACQKRQVIACHCPLAAMDSVAELALTLALGSLRHVRHGQLQMEAGEFRKGVEKGQLLKDKTWGVFGYGRTGSRTAHLIEPLVKHVIKYDPYTLPDPDMKTFFSEADIVSVHVPLTSKTQGLFNSERFQVMKKGALLINVSRGSVVNEADLISALKSGQISAAGLDVFAEEPLKSSSPLLQHPQILCTPHIGAYCPEVLALASMQAAETIIQFMGGQNLEHALPESAEWAVEARSSTSL